MTVDFRHARFVLSANAARFFPPDAGNEVAFAGRSNAGKSSALNAIAGRRSLARVSKTPGRTQLINFFDLGDGRRLVDLPGYGYARVPERVRRHWRTLMESYFGARSSLSGLVLVVDVRHPGSEFDEQMLAWARARRCPVHLLLTKSDKLSRGAASSVLHRLRRERPELAGVQLFSALRHDGVEEARAAVASLLGPDGGVSASGDRLTGEASDEKKSPGAE